MSSSTLYNGTSEGFTEVCNGYIDYAKEIISGRSVPDVRDGLKPVSRRIVYACAGHKGIRDNLTKSATLVGKVLEYHPHGDSSVYGTFCSMVDTNGSMNIPIFIGQGEFGRVHSVGTPAAMRYTKAKFNVTADDYLRDMDACNMIPAEEGEGFEPEVLPVRYPSALVNGTSGMAVSVSTFIPSFNMMDVLNITQEYLKKGKIETIITPDFPTGGIIVKDDTELSKIMMVGKGRLKIRARVEIEGKDIHVKEVPFGKTVESIIQAINNADIPGVQSVRDAVGLQSTNLVTITCKTLKSVEGVLMLLYKHRILQTSVSSNMLFVDKGEPLFLGVHGVIERWVKWREQIVTTKFTKMLESINPELVQLDYFMRLVSNEEWKATMLDKLAYKSKKEGKEYLKEIFEDIPDEVCDWIIKRDVPSYNKGDRYARRYGDLLALKEEYEGYLANVDEYIYNDIEDLKKSRAYLCERKTEETYLDYKFSKISDIEMEDESFCIYTLYKDGFLTKTRDTFIDTNGREIVAQIPAQANSTLIGFDCYGRLLRVFGSDIPFTDYGSNGEYLHRYFDADGYEGYNIMYLGLLDGKKRMLVYRDGFIGFLDTSEWVGKKKVRVNQRGVDVNVYNALVEVIEEDDFNDYLVVAEDSGKKVRFGVTEVSQIREASRKSRAKVFGGSNPDIRYTAMMSYMDLLKFMEDPMNFYNRMKPLGNREVYGDAGEIMKEGRYYE